MLSSNLVELEQAIRHLSREEQLWLIERIIHSLRLSLPGEQPEGCSSSETQLVMMASDPEVQAELSAIDQAFAIAEMDGLE